MEQKTKIAGNLTQGHATVMTDFDKILSSGSIRSSLKSVQDQCFVNWG